jgi:hypothetical protein
MPSCGDAGPGGGGGAEVGDPQRLGGRVEQQVPGTKIAVHEAACMQRGQGAREHEHEPRRQPPLPRAGPEPADERHRPGRPKRCRKPFWTLEQRAGLGNARHVDR